MVTDGSGGSENVSNAVELDLQVRSCEGACCVDDVLMSCSTVALLAGAAGLSRAALTSLVRTSVAYLLVLDYICHVAFAIELYLALVMTSCGFLHWQSLWTFADREYVHHSTCAAGAVVGV